MKMNHTQFEEALRSVLHSKEDAIAPRAEHTEALRRDMMHLYRTIQEHSMSQQPQRSRRTWLALLIPAGVLAAGALIFIVSGGPLGIQQVGQKIAGNHTPVNIASNLSAKEVLAESLENTLGAITNNTGRYIVVRQRAIGNDSFVTEERIWKQGLNYRSETYSIDNGNYSVPESLLHLADGSGVETNCGIQVGFSCETSTEPIFQHIDYTATPTLNVSVKSITKAAQQVYNQEVTNPYATVVVTLHADKPLSQNATAHIDNTDRADDGMPFSESATLKAGANAQEYMVTFNQVEDLRRDDKVFADANPDSFANYFQIRDGENVSRVYRIDFHTMQATEVSTENAVGVVKAVEQYNLRSLVQAAANDALGSISVLSRMQFDYETAIKNGEVIESRTEIVNGVEQQRITYKYYYPTDNPESKNEYYVSLFTIDTATKRLLSVQEIESPYMDITSPRIAEIVELRDLSDEERTTIFTVDSWKQSITDYYRNRLQAEPPTFVQID